MIIDRILAFLSSLALLPTALAPRLSLVMPAPFSPSPKWEYSDFAVFCSLLSFFTSFFTWLVNLAAISVWGEDHRAVLMMRCSKKNKPVLRTHLSFLYSHSLQRPFAFCWHGLIVPISRTQCEESWVRQSTQDNLNFPVFHVTSGLECVSTFLPHMEKNVAHSPRWRLRDSPEMQNTAC